MNGNTIGVVVVLAIVIIGGGFFLKAPADAPESQTVTNGMPVIGSTTQETVVENTSPNITVAYTDQGFLPASVTVPLGTTVTFVNQSSNKMWVASAMHPTHVVYSGTSLSQHCPDTTNSAFDECTGDEPGETYSFTFNKEGVWKYHDHINSKMFGSVTVTTSSASTTPILPN